jgi:hypothetical protein
MIDEFDQLNSELFGSDLKDLAEVSKMLTEEDRAIMWGIDFEYKDSLKMEKKQSEDKPKIDPITGLYDIFNEKHFSVGRRPVLKGYQLKVEQLYNKLASIGQLWTFTDSLREKMLRYTLIGNLPFEKVFTEYEINEIKNNPYFKH